MQISSIVTFTLPMMTDVQKGAIAADRLALTRPPGGQKAQHWVPIMNYKPICQHYLNRQVLDAF